MRIIMAQQNTLVGDIEGNARIIIKAAEEARRLLGAELVLFPELVLTGYPPEDLLLRPSLNSRVDDALARIGQEISVPVVIGYPAVRNGMRRNSAGVLFPGDTRPRHEYFKQHLPNYRVFDEKRYFQPGDRACVFELNGQRFGLTICEDIWHSGPASQLQDAGVDVVLNLNASPFRAGKVAERLEQVQARCRETGLPVLYCNLVGGQDELVFDGASFACGADGERCVQGASFADALIPVDLNCEAGSCRPRGELLPVPGHEESLYQALVLATRDYVNKNGFKGALLGLSGGIDSALTLAVAVDALGPERVEAVMMPFRYTSAISVEDAEKQARTLRVHYRVLPIESAFNGFMDILAEPFAGLPTDTTEENLQARCRGVLLMALSNKNGSVVLTTGNKSEMAVGYATLYGDMAGGFSVLKDVFKTWVFRLARWRNQQAGAEIIPERVISRPPSAELAPDQVDSDSLPDYDQLDAILERYVEQDMSAEAVIRDGFERDTVYRVVKLTDRNEYKRRQAAVGPRVSRRAFGKDRRYPITNGWRPGD
ncbi:NAD+ synthetase [Alcanivorax hongdengensis A-11-3]|uniref:Glutamine-dependent NAD(+) synthetase n=1 Tax=Alcanivorax hongdengensis A-11-3 TaxID=1177179 RepID=L0WBY7_9GAMM|nr:NAD+ synthase [Alcanivorax hongdengensis]EKF74499.1 NAD+ synthetase [Alcanivorax hongdengensis A-11-3]